MPIESKTRSGVGITPLLVLAYAGYYLSGTLNSRFETMGYGALSGSALLILALILAIRVVNKGHPIADVTQWITRRPSVMRDHASAVVTAVSLLIYIYAQQRIGFLPASALAALWFPFFLKAGSLMRVVCLAVFLTALAWLLLLEVLSVPLPAGPWRG